MSREYPALAPASPRDSWDWLQQKPPRPHKRDEAVIDNGWMNVSFKSTTVGNDERPQCVVCLKIIASDSIKPNKLRLDIPSTKRSPLISSEKNYSTVVYSRVALLKQRLCLQMINSPPTKSCTELLSVKSCTQ